MQDPVGIEREGSPETPRDKTIKLLHLLERLPTHSGKRVQDVLYAPNADFKAVSEFKTEKDELAEQRNRNEFKWLFMKKYGEVMRDAQVTEGCKEFMLWSIDLAYNKGVNPETRLDESGLEDFTIHKPVPEPFVYLIYDFIDNPNSGGLFTEDSAQNLEMKIYNRALSDFELISAYIEQARDVFESMDKDLGPSFSSRKGADEAFVEFLPFLQEVWAGLPTKGDSVEEIESSYQRLFEVWRMQIEHRYGITPHTEFSTDPKFLASPLKDSK